MLLRTLQQFIRRNSELLLSCLETRAICSLLAISIVCLALGCEKGQTIPFTSENMQKEINDGISKIMDNPELTLEELEKLRQYEYRVITAPLNTPPLNLESTLNESGKNRWDCFHIDKTMTLVGGKREERFLIFCKRPPETPLRFLPKSLMGY